MIKFHSSSIIQSDFDWVLRPKKKSSFQLIKSDFQEYRESKLTLENYFDVEIVLCNMSHHNSSFSTTVTSVQNRPIFIGCRVRGNYTNYFIISLTDVKCSPIKISIENLFRIYGIENHIGDPIDVYQHHKVNLVFRKIQVSYL